MPAATKSVEVLKPPQWEPAGLTTELKRICNMLSPATEIYATPHGLELVTDTQENLDRGRDALVSLIGTLVRHVHFEPSVTRYFFDNEDRLGELVRKIDLITTLNSVQHQLDTQDKMIVLLGDLESAQNLEDSVRQIKAFEKKIARTLNENGLLEDQAAPSKPPARSDDEVVQRIRFNKDVLTPERGQYQDFIAKITAIGKDKGVTVTFVPNGVEVKGHDSTAVEIVRKEIEEKYRRYAEFMKKLTDRATSASSGGAPSPAPSPAPARTPIPTAASTSAPAPAQPASPTKPANQSISLASEAMKTTNEAVIQKGVELKGKRGFAWFFEDTVSKGLQNDKMLETKALIHINKIATEYDACMVYGRVYGVSLITSVTLDETEENLKHLETKGLLISVDGDDKISRMIEDLAQYQADVLNSAAAAAGENRVEAEEDIRIDLSVGVSEAEEVPNVAAAAESKDVQEQQQQLQQPQQQQVPPCPYQFPAWGQGWGDFGSQPPFMAPVPQKASDLSVPPTSMQGWPAAQAPYYYGMPPGLHPQMPPQVLRGAPPHSAPPGTPMWAGAGWGYPAWSQPSPQPSTTAHPMEAPVFPSASAAPWGFPGPTGTYPPSQTAAFGDRQEKGM
ncbi:hypothetical protein HK104_006054 [Borealophlyctis nickersoniae]|nr:hypothetical protein HK104_006054 [Borealophlyctis nickersoniae]